MNKYRYEVQLCDGAGCNAVRWCAAEAEAIEIAKRYMLHPRIRTKVIDTVKEESEMYKKCHHCGDLLLDEEIYRGDADMILCPVCYCDLSDNDVYTYCINCGDIITQDDIDHGKYFEADGGGLLCSECAADV